MTLFDALLPAIKAVGLAAGVFITLVLLANLHDRFFEKDGKQ